MAMLHRLILCSLIVLFGGGVVTAQGSKAERAKRLRTEIAALKAKLAKLEEALAKLEGKPAQPKPKQTMIYKAGIEVGQVGPFGYGNEVYHILVDRIIDENSAVLRVRHSNAAYLRVLAEKFPTKGLADGKLITKSGTPTPIWKVTGTKKVGFETLYTVEPVASEK